MNILPKKKWHVRTKENIARVRKDEAEAAEQEKEKERRAKLAEQESRTALLRKRAKEFNPLASINSGEESIVLKPDSVVEADIYTSSGNINFFKEIEAGIQKSGSNKEHEEEKKEEREDYEKKIGLLTYLGQDTLESTGKVEWYTEEKYSLSKLNTQAISANESSEVGLKGKSYLDPMKEILKHTDTKMYLPLIKSPAPINIDKSDNLDRTHHKSKNICRKDKKHKKKKKKDKCNSKSKKIKKRKRLGSPPRSSYKKKKRRKVSSSSCCNSDLEEKNNKKIKLAKMRDERLKREAIERKREERLLAGKDPDAEDKKPESSAPFKQKYHSQFNPQLAKQNIETKLPIPTGLQPGVKYWLQ